MQWFFRRRILKNHILLLVFLYYLPFEKNFVLYFENFEFPFQNVYLYQFLLIWSSGSREKVKHIKRVQTYQKDERMRTTGDQKNWLKWAINQILESLRRFWLIIGLLAFKRIDIKDKEILKDFLSINRKEGLQSIDCQMCSPFRLYKICGYLIFKWHFQRKSW